MTQANDRSSISERRTGDERRRGLDRRQQSIPVAVDRRSGVDRRALGERRGSRAEFARFFAAAFAE
jgi:hypothetical protein